MGISGVERWITVDAPFLDEILRRINDEFRAPEFKLVQVVARARGWTAILERTGKKK